MYKICSVIVTYNRKDLLVRNIESVLKQKYPVDILIYDNASTDGTEEYLVESGIIGKKEITYVKGSRNSGGAGGFRFGAQKACEKGYEYLWLMDDDGFCINDNTLTELVNVIKPEQKEIYNSYVTYDSQTLEPTFDLKGVMSRQEICYKAKDNIVDGGFPYNGTLIPRFCFEEVGFNDDRFFIYGDENDFYYRTKEKGYEWKTVLNSLYYHPVNRNIIKKFRFAGLYCEVKKQPVWKYYLEVRNAEINAIRHFHKSRHRMIGYIRVILVSLHSEDKKMKRMKYGFLGIKDAKREYFDRPLMFNA